MGVWYPNKTWRSKLQKEDGAEACPNGEKYQSEEREQKQKTKKKKDPVGI